MPSFVNDYGTTYALVKTDGTSGFRGLVPRADMVLSFTDVASCLNVMSIAMQKTQVYNPELHDAIEILETNIYRERSLIGYREDRYEAVAIYIYDILDQMWRQTMDDGNVNFSPSQAVVNAEGLRRVYDRLQS